MGDIVHGTPAKTVTCEETRVMNECQSRSKSWRRHMTSRLIDSLRHKGSVRTVVKASCNARSRSSWSFIRGVVYTGFV